MDAETLEGNELLILEDERATCTLYEAFFKGLCDVDIVHTPEEVFEQVESTEYDLLLLDIHLKHEELDGGGVLRQVRENDAYKETPVLAVTAHAMPGDKTKFLEKGFDGYIAKPFTRKQLVKSVSEYL